MTISAAMQPPPASAACARALRACSRRTGAPRSPAARPPSVRAGSADYAARGGAARAARSGSRGAGCTRGRSACTPGRRSVSSSGAGSRPKLAFLRFRRPSQVSAVPVLPRRVGKTQSNMSMPRSITSRMPARVADAHEVARLLVRKQRRRPGRRLEHLAPVLADREPAERVAVEVELLQLVDGTSAKLPVGVPLRDAEQQLAGRAVGGSLARGPLRRAAHRALEVGARDARRRHVVEAHRDVRAERCAGSRPRSRA